MTNFSSNHPSQKRSSLMMNVALAITVLGLITLGWQYYSTADELHQSEESLARAIQLSDSIQQRTWLFSEILRADAYLIDSGNIEMALRVLGSILDTTQGEHEEMVLERIAQLNASLNKKERSLQTREQMEFDLFRLEKQVKRMENEKDSISSKSKQRILQAERRWAAANDSLIDLKEQLSRKSKIQVITFAGRKSNKIHYMGEVEDGKANGGGVGIWQTGSIYRGNWKNNTRHGKGTYEWVDGERYDGEYVDDIRSGKGTYYWPSGERYEGGWENDMRNGQGTLFDMDGNVRYKGQWVNDKPVTNGGDS